jgi:hypothetical protein
LAQNGIHYKSIYIICNITLEIKNG